MTPRILHNPRCSKSRAALALLEAAGPVEVVRYLEVPSSTAELARLYARAGMRPADGLRRGEAGADTLDPGDDTAVLAAMAADPRLIERPLVETSKGVVLARPPERVREIL